MEEVGEAFSMSASDVMSEIEAPLKALVIDSWLGMVSSAVTSIAAVATNKSR
ncbi:hypothetical protein Plhal304r1_c008g0033961 [Plasmopara halstedii]